MAFRSFATITLTHSPHVHPQDFSTELLWMFLKYNHYCRSNFSSRHPNCHWVSWLLPLCSPLVLYLFASWPPSRSIIRHFCIDPYRWTPLFTDLVIIFNHRVDPYHTQCVDPLLTGQTTMVCLQIPSIGWTDTMWDPQTVKSSSNRIACRWDTSHVSPMLTMLHNSHQHNTQLLVRLHSEQQDLYRCQRLSSRPSLSAKHHSEYARVIPQHSFVGETITFGKTSYQV